MFGAVYGDVIGSYYETHCTKDYNFEFQKESTFTDDTVLTVAVCKAILNNPQPITRWQIRDRAIEYAGQYKQYYSFYPHSGFGNMFSQWARDPEFRKNRSYGNGAAMRAVPIGYAYDDIKQILLQAKASCLYTHNDIEAITGAQVVAVATFLARKGTSKNEIRTFLKKKFGWELTASIEDLRKTHVFDSRSSYSVPAAIIAFLDSHDYESAVRNAVSLGGDADTQACIAGGIAQAYYKEIPKHIGDFCNRRIDYSLRKIITEFEEQFNKELI